MAPTWIERIRSARDTVTCYKNPIHPLKTKAMAVNAHSEIDVCICTFQRPSLAQTLGSIAQQRLGPNVSLRVIIADNDDTPSAKALADETCQALGLNHLYVHAPARNISIARNACLDASTAPLIAFIDDDEEASPNWLSHLLSALETEQLDAVFGPVRAIYLPDAAPWVSKADLHSTQPAFRSSGEIDTGYTCNVIFRREAVKSARFDPDLGRSGGEDTVFFATLAHQGARLGFSATAEVSELVPPHRAELMWLLRRSFRSGQSHGRTLVARSRRRLPQAVIAASKAAYCLLSVCLRSGSAVEWRKAAVRGALHAGVVTRLLGSRDLKLY